MGLLSDVVGSITGGNEAARAGREAAGMSREMFDVSRKELRPFIDFGLEGMASVRDLMMNPDQLSRMPFFQFLQEQGTQAVTRAAAASGFRGSGNVLHDLMSFGQGLASTEFGNEFMRRMSLAQLGANAAGTLAGAATNTGNTMASSVLQGGMARANLQGSFLNSILGAGASIYSMNQLSKYFGSTSGIK